MNRHLISFVVFLSFPLFAYPNPAALKIGEPFTKMRSALYADGWRADPASHAASGEYMGLERNLVRSGYIEVDYCSIGKTSCVLQYTKGKACLRLYTQGEQIPSMKVESWSGDCREPGKDEGPDVLPADVRYADQWRRECEELGECQGLNEFLRTLGKKDMHGRR